MYIVPDVFYILHVYLLQLFHSYWLSWKSHSFSKASVLGAGFGWEILGLRSGETSATSVVAPAEVCPWGTPKLVWISGCSSQAGVYVVYVLCIYICIYIYTYIIHIHIHIHKVYTYKNIQYGVIDPWVCLENVWVYCAHRKWQRFNRTGHER